MSWTFGRATQLLDKRVQTPLFKPHPPKPTHSESYLGFTQLRLISVTHDWISIKSVNCHRFCLCTFRRLVPRKTNRETYILSNRLPGGKSNLDFHNCTFALCEWVKLCVSSECEKFASKVLPHFDRIRYVCVKIATQNFSDDSLIVIVRDDSCSQLEVWLKIHWIIRRYIIIPSSDGRVRRNHKQRRRQRWEFAFLRGCREAAGDLVRAQPECGFAENSQVRNLYLVNLMHYT